MSFMGTKTPLEPLDLLVNDEKNLKNMYLFITFSILIESGEYCLTSSADKTVRLWNPHRGLGIKTYKGPGQEVLDATAYVN